MHKCGCLSGEGVAKPGPTSGSPPTNLEAHPPISTGEGHFKSLSALPCIPAEEEEALLLSTLGNHDSFNGCSYEFSVLCFTQACLSSCLLCEGRNLSFSVPGDRKTFVGGCKNRQPSHFQSSKLSHVAFSLIINLYALKQWFPICGSRPL